MDLEEDLLRFNPIRKNNSITLNIYAMKKLDFNAFGVSELETRELLEINGGEPLSELLFALFELIIDAFETFGPEVKQDMIERASRDNYIIWADVGHR